MEKVSSMKDIVNYAAKTYGDNPAIKYKQKKDIVTKTFNDIKSSSQAFSNTLKKLNALGEHIAVIGPTTYEWIITYLGTVNSGSVIVPIDRELRVDDVCDVLKRADVTVFVYDELYADMAKLIKQNCNIKYFINMQQQSNDDFSLSLNQLLNENTGDFDTEIDIDKLCTILFTSGTTGKSKGVMLTHRNITDNVTCVDMGVEQGSVILSVLPIHHAYCFTCDILLGIYLGIVICINDSIMHLVKNLQVFKPNIMLVVPMIVESMYYKLSEAAKANPNVPKPMIAQGALGGNLKTIYSGGAYLNPSLVDEFKEFGISLVQGYGMTECSPRISANFEWLIKNDSVGKIVPGCEVKIVDGEIWAKSSSVMLGYYKNEEATKETLVDGWLRTGDLGHVDEDNFLYITGRKKNLIILSNGENVSPEELENKLHEFPLIQEVLVYGENNLINAEIYPNFEIAKVKNIDDDQLKQMIKGTIDEINKNLPAFKQIHGVKFRAVEFEKTTSKKIKRQQNK